MNVIVIVTLLMLLCAKFASSSYDCDNLPMPLSDSNVTQAVFTNQPYKHWERPVRNANKSIGVQIQLYLRDVIEINEKTQMIRLNGYLLVYWRDEFHVWNNTEPLNCIDQIFVPHGDKSGVWIPDISFSSSENRFELTRSPLEIVQIHSDGLAMFTPGTTLNFHCSFNLALFPYDEQTCTLTFESWDHPMKYQHFEDPTIQVDALHNGENEEWQLLPLIKAEHKIGNYSTGTWDWVVFEIRLKRKPGYYGLIIILPCLLIAAVEVVTFAIPFDKSVRLEVSFTSLLAYSMFQSMMAEEMPHSANNPPLLLILISLFTIYIALAIYLQSLGIYLANKAHRGDAPAPRWLIRLIAFLSFSKKDRKQALAAEESNDSKVWLFIAGVLDRYSCSLFILLLVVTSFVLLVAVPAAADLL